MDRFDVLLTRSNTANTMTRITSSPHVGDGPQLIVLSSAAMMMLLFLSNTHNAVGLGTVKP